MCTVCDYLMHIIYKSMCIKVISVSIPAVSFIASNAYYDDNKNARERKVNNEGW